MTCHFKQLIDLVDVICLTTVYLLLLHFKINNQNSTLFGLPVMLLVCPLQIWIHGTWPEVPLFGSLWHVAPS